MFMKSPTFCSCYFLFTIMLNVLRRYEYFLARSPFFTQVISAGVLAGSGDVIGQTIVEGQRTKETYNLKRTIRFASIATCFVAPVMYRWFRFLETIRGHPRILPLKRVLIDQSIMAPLLTYAFITMIHIMEGKKPKKALENSRKQICPILLTNYKVWPLIQLFNFYFIPLRYRIMLIQTIGILWNAYLSHATQGYNAI